MVPQKSSLKLDSYGVLVGDVNSNPLSQRMDLNPHLPHPPTEALDKRGTPTSFSVFSNKGLTSPWHLASGNVS